MAFGASRTADRRPSGLWRIAHRTPEELVLSVVVTAPEHEAVLGPDNPGTGVEARGREFLGHCRSVQSAVRNVGHIAREQSPGLPSASPAFVQDLACEGGLAAV